MKRTPPILLRITSFVSCAVCPTYCPTKSALETSLSCPEESTPIAFKYFATIRAIVVLPVPGFPVNIICIEMSAALSPFACLKF